MEYKASVIIPVYNADKTLRRCVESLALGNEQDIEVILVDDCSGDSSFDLCQELAAELLNVKAFCNERNSGVSFTRNRGLEHAQGKYILFADSDDWVSERYAESLLRLAEEFSDALPICGQHFIDHVNGYRRIYMWSDDQGIVNQISNDRFFELSEKFLLQQLWNKIFRKDLIEKHHIRFDESQSMGEDFQFVLDYIEAAQIKKCVILNEPLYYYIRWNNSSLMGEFGFGDSRFEFGRMEQLSRIVGSGAQARKEAMIAQSKRSYVYHIVRNSAHSREEKLAAIERIMADGNAIAYYRMQRLQFTKERVAVRLQMAKQLVPRIKGRLQRYRLKKSIANAVSGVLAEGITFISQNCIGGVLYHDLGLQFLSPTINTFIPEPGFVKLVLNLCYYMEQELVMRWEEEYPIGMLDDVEIHFMHYDTCREAKEAWEKRKARINWEKIFVIGTDRDGFDEEIYEQWKQIPYPKILFTAHSEFTEDAVYYPEFAEDGQIGDLISDRKFYRNGALVDKINQLGDRL